MHRRQKIQVYRPVDPIVSEDGMGGHDPVVKLTQEFFATLQKTTSTLVNDEKSSIFDSRMIIMTHHLINLPSEVVILADGVWYGINETVTNRRRQYYFLDEITGEVVVEEVVV